MQMEPLPPPSYARLGPHEAWLVRSATPDMYVLSSACAMCRRMQVSVAAVLAPWDAALKPHLFCVAQAVSAPFSLPALQRGQNCDTAAVSSRAVSPCMGHPG